MSEAREVDFHPSPNTSKESPSSGMNGETGCRLTHPQKEPSQKDGHRVAGHVVIGVGAASSSACEIRENDASNAHDARVTATAAAAATTTRKDWREIYAQKRAKRSARYLKTGRIHEDVNEAQHIWGANIQTATKPGGEQGKEVSPEHTTPSVRSPSPCMQQRSVTGHVSIAVSPPIASPPTVAYSIWLSRGTWGSISAAPQDAGVIDTVS